MAGDTERLTLRCMTEALATGDHVVVVATGERAFVTGYYLPGMDVRVLLESGRFAVFRSAEIERDRATAEARP